MEPQSYKHTYKYKFSRVKTEYEGKVECEVKPNNQSGHYPRDIYFFFFSIFKMDYIRDKII